MPRVGTKWDPTGRWYRVPDWLLKRHGRAGETVWLPAVSTIHEIYQAPELRMWYGKLGTEEAQRIANETAAWGTQAHKMIEQIVLGGSINETWWNAVDEQVRQAVRAWLRWYQVAKFKPSQAEQSVYSLKHGYAGTLDATGYRDGEWTLCDWKTVSRFDFFPRINYLQVGAYLNAYREIYPKAKRFKAVCVVSLNRETGDFNEHRLTAKEAREAFQTFLYAKRVWDFVRRGEVEAERDHALNIEKGGSDADHYQVD